MPMFEFVCSECGEIFEELMSRAEVEAGNVACPKCGGAKVDRRMSGFATAGDAGGGYGGGGCGSGGSGGST